jgi:hypothetical protein
MFGNLDNLLPFSRKPYQQRLREQQRAQQLYGQRNVTPVYQQNVAIPDGAMNYPNAPAFYPTINQPTTAYPATYAVSSQGQQMQYQQQPVVGQQMYYHQHPVVGQQIQYQQQQPVVIVSAASQNINYSDQPSPQQDVKGQEAQQSNASFICTPAQLSAMKQNPSPAGNPIPTGAPNDSNYSPYQSHSGNTPSNVSTFNNAPVYSTPSSSSQYPTPAMIYPPQGLQYPTASSPSNNNNNSNNNSNPRSVGPASDYRYPPSSNNSGRNQTGACVIH